jgi:hypothetical protein
MTESIVIINNGLNDGTWQTELHIEMEKVACSLWRYIGSGNNQSQTFGKQELARFVKTL